MKAAEIRSGRPSPRINLLAGRNARPVATALAREKYIDPRYFLSGYPFLPGYGTQAATVLYRDSLTMSDFPQMQREFRRIKRNDLLILNFIDFVHRIVTETDCFAWKGDYYNIRLTDIKYGKLFELFDGLARIGLEIKEPNSVNYFASKILTFYRLRYSDEYQPYSNTIKNIIIPLLACRLAGDYCDHRVSAQRQITISENPSLYYRRDSEIRDIVTELLTRLIRPEEREHFSRTFRSFLAMQRMNWLLHEKPPLFSREDQYLPPLCVLKNGMRIDLPAGFKSHPSRFIEEQENVQGGAGFPKGIAALASQPYDVTRVKRFKLGSIPIISKRVEPLRGGSVEEEINAAQKIAEKLKANNIPNCRVVEYIGLVYDAGNFYILMKDEQAPSLHDRRNPKGMRVFNKVKKVLSNGEHDDLEPRNALWNSKELVLIDFELHSTTVRVDKLPVNCDEILRARLSRVESLSELDELSGKKGLRDRPLIPGFASATKMLGRARRFKSQRPNIAIGDIHGNVKRLKQIVESEPAKRAGRVIFLGDYFDRDAGGAEVFKVLSGRSNKRDVFLLGNHELLFLLAMKGDHDSFEKWIIDGGLDFLAGFLEGAVDLIEFKHIFEEVRGQMPEGSTIDIIERIKSARPEILRDLHERIVQNKFLLEVFGWLTNNARLYYIDDYGLLYIHAGINKEEGLEYLEKLAKWESEFKKWLLSGEPNSLEEAVKTAKKFRPCLEMREYDWLADFTKDGWQKVRENTLSLGIRGVVYGHTSRSQVSNEFGRFLGIDLSMGDYYGGLGGLLEIGPDGLVSYRFNGRESDELSREEIIDKVELRYDLEKDGQRLIRVYQEHFLNLL